MRPIIGVGSIVLRDGRLLVIERGNDPLKGLWSVPGGRLELGEALADAALRELAEETGLRGRVEGLCGIAERIGPTGHLVIHILLPLMIQSSPSRRAELVMPLGFDP